MNKKFYTLPNLPYGYKDLKPYMSEELLTIHHQKHHAAYVKGANAILEKLNKAREDNVDIDMKAELKALSFNIGGHILHSLFWQNMAPANQGGGGEPSGKIGEFINQEFGGLARFKSEFSQTAAAVEGSGWAALTYCHETDRLVLAQIEKHNSNLHPTLKILLALDVFEHAYYLDYKNERGKFIETFWNIVNWPEVERRYAS